MTPKKKLIRITTVPMSLAGLLKGQLNYMNRFYHVIGISSYADGLIEDIAQWEQVETRPVEMTRKITPIKDLVAVYKLYNIFKKERPFIVHTHTPKAGTLGMLAAKLAGVPNRLHTIAGLPLVEATGPKRWLLNTVEKLTYSWATKIYPNSYGLQEIILNHKFTKPSKLKVLGNGSSNGIDTNRYSSKNIKKEEIKTLRNSLGIKSEDFVYGYVGRLVTDKGINELICAFSEINKHNKNTKLLLVGPYEPERDPLNPETNKIIQSHKDIIATGWQNDVRPYMSIFNVLTFPSYREGFPNVVMQAGAMQLPCIVTNINGCNEIITHGDNGYIIPVKNLKALYEAMETILNLPQEQRKVMGKRSRDKIKSQYEQQMVWAVLLNEYQALES